MAEKPSSGPEVGSIASVKNKEEFGEGAGGAAKRWKAEIDTAKKWRKGFITKAEKVVRRYLDERDAIDTMDRKFNILWSNVQTLLPAIYNKPPVPETHRRFDNNDQPSRVAAIILERNLEYSVCEHSMFDSLMKAAVQDRLIPGLGQGWIRYDAKFGPNLQTPPGEGQAPGPSMDGMAGMATSTDAYGLSQTMPGHNSTEAGTGLPTLKPTTQITDDVSGIPTDEKVCFDYVHWQDYFQSPARTWEEVTWVARRVYMTQEEGVARFGEAFKKIPLSYKAEKNVKGGDDGQNQSFGPGLSVMQKAAVYEIWSKSDKKVFWLSDETPTILDEKDDILGLKGFFPCPKPLLATTTTNSLSPTPDFCMYQDQAYELDLITNRISMLTQACKVVGVYDKTQDAVQRVLTEGVDNVMIPVDNWAMFAERGGLKGVVDFFPVEMVMGVLEKLLQARNVIKQDIYEITGLADIVRGASVASETATAQNIKAKFANIRISDTAQDIARFASDLVNMAAEVMTNFFQPETLLTNADLNPQTSPDAQYIPAALEIIKSGQVIKHKIVVSVDSITAPDDEEEKKGRVEFLQALGMFMQQAVPAVQQMPEMAAGMGQIVLWGVRGFKVGRDIEGILEQGLSQLNKQQAEGGKPKEPSPEEKKAQAELQIMQQTAALDAETAQQKAALEAQTAQEESARKAAEHEQDMQFKEREFQQKLQFQEREFQLKMEMMQAEAATKLEIEQTKASANIAVKGQEMEMKAEAHDQGIQQGAEVHESTQHERREEAALNKLVTLEQAEAKAEAQEEKTEKASGKD